MKLLTTKKQKYVIRKIAQNQIAALELIKDSNDLHPQAAAKLTAQIMDNSINAAYTIGGEFGVLFLNVIMKEYL